MNSRPYLLTLFLAAALTLAPSTYAILGLFGDDKKEAPSAEQLAEQESAAMEAFATASALAKEGKGAKARSAYEAIVKNYPFTQQAAASQFQVGSIYESENDIQDAFEAYQVLIDRYGGSDQFGEAIKRQFEIATKAMNSKTTRVLGIIPSKAAKSDVIDMFNQVASNAPQSKYAPLSLYQIGVLYNEGGQKPDAIVAFQKLIDNYPNDPIKKEAQVQIFDIRGGIHTRNVAHAEQNAVDMAVFVDQNEDDPRAEELRERLGKLEDKEAEKSFNVGRYYERKGNLRAAAMYYQEVRASDSEFHRLAQVRLEELKAQDPNLLQAPSAPKHKVVAPVNTVDREDYYGPKPPKLEAAPRPKMRVSEVDIQPIPSSGS